MGTVGMAGLGEEAIPVEDLDADKKNEELVRSVHKFKSPNIYRSATEK